MSSTVEKKKPHKKKEAEEEDDMLDDLMKVGFQDTKNANVIHLRKQMRNGRKCYTLVEGIPDIFNHKKITKYLKKNLQTNGV